MVFIDNLAVQLFALGISGMLISFMAIDCYLTLLKKKDIHATAKKHATGLAIFGFYIFLSGILGQATWTLPGSYNILFYDLYPIYGLLLIASVWAIYRKEATKGIGISSLFLGLLSIYYGWQGFLLNMSREPTLLLALYLTFGIAGILGLPATVAFDKIIGKNSTSKDRYALVALFVVFLVLGSMVSFLIGGASLPAHLASAP